MRNLVPDRALARRSRNLLIAAGFTLLIGTLLAVIGVTMRVIPLVVPSNAGFPLYDALRHILIVVGAVGVLAALAMAVRALTWKQDNPLAERVAEELAFLDDHHVFIRNVSKLSLGYIDAVLLGPPGALVFRITDREGVFFNDGKYWLKQREKGEWQTMRWNPTREAADDVVRLREFLAVRGLGDVPVYGAIVFTGESPLVQLSAQNPLLPALHASALSYDLSDTYFKKQDRIDQATVEKLTTLLAQ